MRPLPTPQPPAQGRGADRTEWVAARALRELEEHDDQPALLSRYERGEGLLVDAWFAMARPRRVQRRTLNGIEQQLHRAWPDAPSGLKRREIVDGLVRAAQRFRHAAGGPTNHTEEQ